MINEIDNVIFTKKILIETVKEENKIVKYIINLIIALGSLSFLIVGLSSYTNTTLIPFLKADEIVFFPQGLTMTLYGIVGTLISINQYIVLLSNIGEGFNEFNKEKGTMTIFRKGRPGKNEDINIVYPLNDIEAIKIEIKSELINTKQTILACIKNKKNIPIIQLEQPINLNELEEKAIKIAAFLKVPVKGI